MDRAYFTTLGTHTVQCLYGVNGIAVNFMNTKETMDGWRPCFRFVVSHAAELDVVIGWVYRATTDLQRVIHSDNHSTGSMTST